MQVNQEWFEMKKECRADVMRAAWIPLILLSSKRQGNHGYEGFVNETHVVTAIIVPQEKKEEALSLDWEEVRSSYNHVPYIENGSFHSADEYNAWRSHVPGIHPVLVQYITDEPNEWQLHHDIVLGLRLKREGDIWLCPDEDYEKVAEFQRSEDGEPEGIFIRMEYLRDFLCACSSGLLIASYRERAVTVSDKPTFTWVDNHSQFAGEHYRWEGFIAPVAKGGLPFGSKTAYIRVGRKTSAPEDEVPVHGEGDEDIVTSFEEIKHEGEMLYDVRGMLWRNEWLPPAERSPRVRRDSEESTVEFIIDAAGKRAAGMQLERLRGWLWFKPSVISELLSKRRGMLEWYTHDTGRVGPGPSHGVHFGVNSKGLINVYAKDIYILPDVYARIWQAYNVPPDGHPSQELWMSQMQSQPAETIAPEAAFFSVLAYVEKISHKKMGRPLLKQHATVPDLLRNIHRFRANNIQGLCALAKDLDKLISERIDTKLLDNFTPPPDKNLRSIKRLAHFLNAVGKNGRDITAPLVGINILRQGDAHLPSSDLLDALKLVHIDNTGNHIAMAQRMIEMICVTLAIIADSIEKSDLKLQ